MPATSLDVPDTVDALRQAPYSNGNAAQFRCGRQCCRAHPCRRIRTCGANRIWRRSKAQWGPAPGRALSDGRSIFVLGAQFGNVFVGVQPAFGYEGDPMRLLFEHGFAPTHAFSAFYRWMREDFGGPCGAAFRHAWRAGVHARQAGGPVRRVLAGPADRGSAELQFLRLQQPVRGPARQAPGRGGLDQLFDAAGDAGGAVSGLAGCEDVAGPLARAAAGRGARSTGGGAGRLGAGAGCRGGSGGRRSRVGRMSMRRWPGLGAALLELEYALDPARPARHRRTAGCGAAGGDAGRGRGDRPGSPRGDGRQAGHGSRACRR